METGLLTDGLLTGTVIPRTDGPTLYTRWGEWAAYLAVLLALVAVVLQQRLAPVTDEAAELDQPIST